jgi:hypothetical protein
MAICQPVGHQIWLIADRLKTADCSAALHMLPLLPLSYCKLYASMQV